MNVQIPADPVDNNVTIDIRCNVRTDTTTIQKKSVNKEMSREEELQVRLDIVERELCFRIEAENAQRASERKILQEEEDERKNIQMEKDRHLRMKEQYRQLYAQCCVLPSDQLLLHYSSDDLIRPLWYFSGNRLSTKRVAYGAFSLLIIAGLWFTALAFTGIRMQTELNVYDSYKVTHVEMNTTVSEHLCAAPGCEERCTFALSRQTKYVWLTTNGVDCDLPHGSWNGVIRFGFALAFLFQLCLCPCIWITFLNLVSACRHCKHY